METSPSTLAEYAMNETQKHARYFFEIQGLRSR